MVGANSETALYVPMAWQPTLLTKTHYAEDSPPPTEGWSDWAHVELSCRQPEGFSRRCPEHPDEPSFTYYQVLPQAAPL